MAMLEIRGVHKSFHTYAKPGVHPGIFGRAPKPTSSLDVLRGVDLTVEKTPISILPLTAAPHIFPERKLSSE